MLWLSNPLPIHFLLYLARGVMNSSFWKMGIAKNRPLLLLLFVPGSSRASFRSTATDDREDLTFPLSLSLSSLFASAALHVPCSAVYRSILTFSPLLLLSLFYVCCHWCFCTTVCVITYLSISLDFTGFLWCPIGSALCLFKFEANTNVSATTVVVSLSVYDY